MKYTKAQRAEIALVYGCALAVLPDVNDCRGSSPFICDNIKGITFNGITFRLGRKSAFNPRNEAKAIISERINHYMGIDTWLVATYPHLEQAIIADNVDNRGRKLQAYRKEWLRKLIEEFSK